MLPVCVWGRWSLWPTGPDSTQPAQPLIAVAGSPPRVCWGHLRASVWGRKCWLRAISWYVGPCQICQPSSVVITPSSKNPEFGLSLGCRVSRTRQKNQPCSAPARGSGLPQQKPTAGKTYCLPSASRPCCPRGPACFLPPTAGPGPALACPEKPGSSLSTAKVTASLTTRACLSVPALPSSVMAVGNTTANHPGSLSVWILGSHRERDMETVGAAFRCRERTAVHGCGQDCAV